MEQKHYAALKSDGNKGVILCQATGAASFIPRKWSLWLCVSLGDVVSQDGGFHKMNKHQKSITNITLSKCL